MCQVEVEYKLTPRVALSQEIGNLEIQIQLARYGLQELKAIHENRPENSVVLEAGVLSIRGIDIRKIVDRTQTDEQFKQTIVELRKTLDSVRKQESEFMEEHGMSYETMDREKAKTVSGMFGRFLCFDDEE